MTRTVPILTTLLFSLLVWTGCDRGEPGAVPPPTEPVDVTVASAATAPAAAAYPATVTSTDEAELATRVSGTVERVRVDVGSRVSAGDTLLEVDATDVEAGIEGAEASVRQARKTFERIRNLEEDGAATEQELDDARAALERARAKLASARGQRDYVVMRAPFSGTVTSRTADPGDLAVPGRPVLQLVRPGSVKLVADLPDRVGTGLEEGDRATVRDPETGSRRAVRVHRVSPAQQPGSRRIRAEFRYLDTDAPAPVPGSYVRLELAATAGSTLWIPADAVVRRGQLSGVFTIHRDSLALRWLRLGDERSDAAEVLGGLQPGDRVVRRPGPALRDGVPVGTVRSEEWQAGGPGATR